MKLAAFIALAVFLAGCASERVVYAPLPPPPDPHTQMAALETRVFELIQDQRRKLEPDAKVLVLDSELMGVARKRSADMAAKNYMTHVAPDGTTSTTLIMDEDPDFQGLLGETIAAQYYVTQRGVNVDDFARTFVDIWMKSADHRSVILTRAYDRTGIGTAVNGNTVYVVELFASNLGLPPPPHPQAPKPPAVPTPRP